MTTPAFIMAVPWKVEREQRALGLAGLIGATVIWDEHHDPMETLGRAFAAMGEGPALLMEDDVILHRDWRERVERVIAGHPDSVCQFFSQRRGDLERQKGSRWEPGRSFIANLCVYLPAGMPPQLLDRLDGWAERHPEDPTACDFVIREHLAETRQRYWMEVPSLVQHETWHSSINPRRPRNRISQTFEGG